MHRAVLYTHNFLPPARLWWRRKNESFHRPGGFLFDSGGHSAYVRAGLCPARRRAWRRGRRLSCRRQLSWRGIRRLSRRVRRKRFVHADDGRRRLRTLRRIRPESGPFLPPPCLWSGLRIRDRTLWFKPHGRTTKRFYVAERAIRPRSEKQFCNGRRPMAWLWDIGWTGQRAGARLWFQQFDVTKQPP